MTTIQDRLKRAIEATAGQVTDDRIPPFRAPEPARRFARPIAGRMPRWLPPLAAAASLAIVAAGVVVVSDIRQQNLSGIRAVPPYYASLNPPNENTGADLTIRSTTTGQVLATVRKPAPSLTFSQVTAAADDRTFVAAAEPRADNGHRSLRLYLLRFNPSSDAVSVTELPITGVSDAGTIALSPNGKYLAVIDGDRIHVFSVPSGAERSWSSPPPLALGLIGLIGPPAWVGGNRYLAYFIDTRFAPSAAPYGTYLLDTTSLSKNWLSASHQPAAALRRQCSPSYFLPQRSMIVCTSLPGPDKDPKAYVIDVSLTTGKVLRRFPLPALVRYADYPAPILAWAGGDGTTAVVLMPVATGPTSVFGVTPTVAKAFVVTSHGFTELPDAVWRGVVVDIPPAAW